VCRTVRYHDWRYNLPALAVQINCHTKIVDLANPSAPAQAAGIAALSDREFLHRSLELNSRTLRYLTFGLEEIGITVVPFACEFRHGRPAMRGGGIPHFSRVDGARRGVRPLKAFDLPNCLPISIETFRRSYAAIAGTNYAY